MSEIKVSVICTAYNHEKYIRDALEGFVKQKTNFSYEVIVHDDASTDGTQQIIKEFAKKYPNIIVPIFQKENQYSKGVYIVRDIVSNRVNGKYVAFCEGDDFWSDYNKLQRQYEFLEKNPEYVACVHNTRMIDLDKKKDIIKYETSSDIDIGLKDVLPHGGSAFHTSSLFMRKEYLILPDEFFVPSVGDYPRAIYLALCGKIRYFKDVMSVYRYNVPGSWSKRQTRGTSIKYLSGIIHCLENTNKVTHYEFEDIINPLIHQRNFDLLYVQQKQRTLIKEYKDIIKKLPFTRKVKLYIHAYFPFIQMMREKKQ